MMGYPMSWGRILDRNNLRGNYTKPRGFGGHEIKWMEPRERSTNTMLSGDLRRLEQDSTDGGPQCQWLALRAGVPLDTFVTVMKVFFDEAPKLPPHDHFTNPEEVKPEVKP